MNSRKPLKTVEKIVDACLVLDDFRPLQLTKYRRGNRDASLRKIAEELGIFCESLCLVIENILTTRPYQSLFYSKTAPRTDM